MLAAVSSDTPGLSCCLGDTEDSSRGSLGACTEKHARPLTRSYGRNGRMDGRHRRTTSGENPAKKHPALFLKALWELLPSAPMTASTATSRIFVPAAMISNIKA